MRDRLFIAVMLMPAMALLMAFYGYPIFDNFRMSLTDLSLLGMTAGGSWGEFGHILFNTLVWLTAVSVTVRLLMGLGIAVLLNTRALRKLRMATISRFALLIPWATPPVVAVVIWRWLLDPRGAVNQALLGLG